MSDTSSIFPSAQGFTQAFMDPRVQGLLGLAGGLAQAAMPSRLPVPTGAAIGMGAQGMGQGLASSMSLQNQNLQLQLAQARQPLFRQMISGQMGGAPFGMPQMPPGGGSPQPGGGGGGQMPQGQSLQSPQAMQGAVPGAATSPAQLIRQSQMHAALGMNDLASQEMKAALEMAGGTGFTPHIDGSSSYTPGAGQDPSVIARNEGAKDWAAVAPDLAKQGLASYGGGIGAIPGYNAAKAAQTAAVANAGVPAALAGQGYASAGAGGLGYIAGGPADPNLAGQRAGQVAAGQEAARAPYTPVAMDARNPDGTVSSRTMSGAQFAATMRAQESGNNPGAINPGSTAGGAAQFTDPTFQDFIAAKHPELAGAPPAVLAQLKQVPGLTDEATQWNAQRNGQILGGQGLPANAATLALAHRFGAQGATDILRAPPATPLSAIPSMAGALAMGPNGQPINPDLAGKTAGQVATNTKLRMGTLPVSFGQGQSSAPSGQLPGIQGKPVMTPEQQTASQGYGEQRNTIMQDAAQARAVMPKLDILRNAQAAFTPGASASIRLAGGQHLVDGLTQAGFTPPAWLVNGVTGGETIQKEGMSLATAVAKGMGREPGFIVSMIAKNLPNISMSNGGYSAILNGLQQEAQRKVDLGQFQDQWLASGNSSIAGMQAQFDRQYPREAYASRVVPFAAPKDPATLIPNVFYRSPNGTVAKYTGNGQFAPVGAGQ